ncbi:MAG: TetR/AcrR family transcriptional regulator [Thiohalocapsa sp.]
MPRPTKAKQKIERAAIELFAGRGIDGVSIGEVAACAGVSQGALYRHYPSKEALARSLFADSYERIGAELVAICRRERDLTQRIAAMVAHFCRLYDSDAALFRFLLLTQHDFLPSLGDTPSAAPSVIAAAVAAATAAGELPPVDPALGAAVVMGVVLQAATFHLYGRLIGPLAGRATALAAAALAALRALA